MAWRYLEVMSVAQLKSYRIPS